LHTIELIKLIFLGALNTFIDFLDSIISPHSHCLGVILNAINGAKNHQF